MHVLLLNVKNNLIYSLLFVLIPLKASITLADIADYPVKNIVFDIGGVLVKYTSESLKQGFTDSAYNPFTSLEHMHQLVHELALQKDSNGNKKYKLYILSNWTTQAFNLLCNHYPELVTHFHGVVISSEVSVHKPDSRIYQCLLDRYALNPSESLFIDDQLPNISGAQELGFLTFHYN